MKQNKACYSAARGPWAVTRRRGALHVYMYIYIYIYIYIERERDRQIDRYI